MSVSELGEIVWGTISRTQKVLKKKRNVFGNIPNPGKRSFPGFGILKFMKGTVVPIPEHAPKVGEVYRHYKGELYEVFELALHSNDDEWMVVYKPLYVCPDAHLFTRPLREWSECVPWNDVVVTRFVRTERGL